MTGLFLSSIRAEKKYISLSESINFFFRNKSMLFASFIIIAITFMVSIIAQSLVGDLVEHSGFFLVNEPAKPVDLIGEIWSFAWTLLHGLYIVFVRITVFYITFFIAYTFSSPLYSLISFFTEKIFKGGRVDDDVPLSFDQAVKDIIEALKLTIVVFAVSIASFFVSAIPLFGPLISFGGFVMINALILFDFAAARKGWSLKKKIQWTWNNKVTSFKIGFIPALVSMIPIFNIFFLVFIYPVFTVYGTLNFILTEDRKI